MYALIHNNQIQVGPRQWSYSFFKEYLVEEGLDFSALTVREQPTGIHTSTYRIVPVTITKHANVEPIYEQPSGPFWTIYEDRVEGEYKSAPVSIDAVKSILKQKAAEERYKKETSGTKAIISVGEVNLYTDRDTRKTYLEALQLIPDDVSTFNFKFSNGFFPVNKGDLTLIVSTIVTHVQAAFDWEAGIVAAIDSATTIAELKAIVIEEKKNAI
jgi:hypothetical protein